MTHANSFHTDYSHKEGSTYANMTSSCHQPNSRLETYLLKLESLCKEHSQKIKANRPTIEQLECQRRFFKRICEKQKQKLEGVNLALIREQYEAELTSLREKRSQMHEMIANIHEEAEEKKANFISTQASLSENRQFLQKSLQDLYAENKRYREMLQKKLETNSNLSSQIEANRQLIKDKEKIEEKYKLVCRQIESREKGTLKGEN